jgi:hypothetical protein
MDGSSAVGVAVTVGDGVLVGPEVEVGVVVGVDDGLGVRVGGLVGAGRGVSVDTAVAVLTERAGAVSRVGVSTPGVCDGCPQAANTRVATTAGIPNRQICRITPSRSLVLDGTRLSDL